jgi:hypothetical protein
MRSDLIRAEHDLNTRAEASLRYKALMTEVSAEASASPSAYVGASIRPGHDEADRRD